MIALGRKCLYPINHVMVYKGHEKNPLLGPYSENVMKRIQMFNLLNEYRREIQRPAWKVTSVAGEEIIDALKDSNPKETLLVIPAGQSTNLDKVFSIAQTSFIKNDFFANGGRGYLTCGSAFWSSETRVFHDLCTEQPEERKTIVKKSKLPLFEGIAEGPLCPYPGKKYQVGFYSDAVIVTDGEDVCTVYLSGGGSFFPGNSSQKVKVLVKYVHSELVRLGKTLQECKTWENAAIMVSVGKGAALFSSFHPYYSSNEINLKAYEEIFGDCGTNWKAVKENLSPIDVRMRFVLKAMLDPLENMDWDMNQ
ncbi:MAG TPA: BPL-N domain-containing protein [Rhabdochlamydiaceae bacterium]|nr:BPL-N domain-containing protein [Rhabdochlamydiaceae bacterium]